LHAPEQTLDNILRAAIQEKRLLQFRYRNKIRIVEPHDYGIYKGVLRLLSYQIGGESSGRLPNWRWMDLDEMSDLELLPQTFAGSRAASASKHHAWDEIFARVD
jgi:predicted DNA-binding transcriptional regulator YafY